MQEKQVVVLQNQNSSTRERVVLKSKMFCYIQREKENTEQHPTLLDDSRMLSMVKRKAFTISTQFKNTPQLPFQFIH